jgi:hypothetical protein
MKQRQRGLGDGGEVIGDVLLTGVVVFLTVGDMAKNSGFVSQFLRWVGSGTREKCFLYGRIKPAVADELGTFGF